MRLVTYMLLFSVLLFVDSMGIALVDLPSQHCYRGMRRRAAVEKNRNLLALANSESMLWKLRAAQAEFLMHQCTSSSEFHTGENVKMHVAVAVSETGTQTSTDKEGPSLADPIVKVAVACQTLEAIVVTEPDFENLMSILHDKHARR